MLGAIVGDIVSSVYEWHNIKLYSWRSITADTTTSQ